MTYRALWTGSQMTNKQRRTRPLSLRLSPAEAAKVRRDAEAAGVGVSEWIRRKALALVESSGAPWRGRWSWLSIHPQRLSGDELGLNAMPWGHVYFDDEGLDLLKRLADVAWYSCGYCFGTGYRSYKTHQTGDPRPGDCPECDGWGVVQAGEWRRRQAEKQPA